MPVYTTEGGWLQLPTETLVQETVAALAAGFRGAKLKVGKPHLSEDVARIAAVREVVGDAFELMVDANQAFTVAEAIRRARAFEPFGLAWLEEPLPADDVTGHAELARHTSLPIAVGESLYSLAQFREQLVEVGNVVGLRHTENVPKHCSAQALETHLVARPPA